MSKKMTPTKRKKAKTMKPWTGWCVVNQHGDHVSTPISTRHDVEVDLAQWHVIEDCKLYRIARVRITELRRGRRK
jgi:hypothetical protein